MFKITLSDIDILKGTIPVIAEIIDEAPIKIDKNGLSILCPDRTMVSVTDLKILSSAFSEFKVDSEETFGINLASLSALLKRVNPGSKLTMESEGKGNRLKITVKSTGLRTFEIPLIDIKTEKPPVDQLSFKNRIEMDTDVFEEGIADADVIGDSVFIETDADSFRMYSKGDVSSTRLELSKKDKAILKFESKDPAKAQYSLEYLKKMVKAAKISKNILVEFGADYPLRISVSKLDKLSLSFILAPRVSEE